MICFEFEELMKIEDKYYLEQLLMMYDETTAPSNRDCPAVEPIVSKIASINLNRRYSKDKLKILAENYSVLNALVYDSSKDFFFSEINPIVIRTLIKILEKKEKEVQEKTDFQEETRKNNIITRRISIVAIIVPSILSIVSLVVSALK